MPFLNNLMIKICDPVLIVLLVRPVAIDQICIVLSNEQLAIRSDVRYSTVYTNEVWLSCVRIKAQFDSHDVIFHILTLKSQEVVATISLLKGDCLILVIALVCGWNALTSSKLPLKILILPVSSPMATIKFVKLMRSLTY